MLIPLELPEEILLLIMELALDFVWDLPGPSTEAGLQSSSELLALSLTCKDLRRLSFHVPMRGSFICTIARVQRRCVIIIGEPFIRTPAHVRQLAALDKWATTEQATNMRKFRVLCTTGSEYPDKNVFLTLGSKVIGLLLKACPNLEVVDLLFRRDLYKTWYSNGGIRQSGGFMPWQVKNLCPLLDSVAGALIAHPFCRINVSSVSLQNAFEAHLSLVGHKVWSKITWLELNHVESTVPSAMEQQHHTYSWLQNVLDDGLVIKKLFIEGKEHIQSLDIVYGPSLEELLIQDAEDIDCRASLQEFESHHPNLQQIMVKNATSGIFLLPKQTTVARCVISKRQSRWAFIELDLPSILTEMEPRHAIAELCYSYSYLQVMVLNGLWEYTDTCSFDDYVVELTRGMRSLISLKLSLPINISDYVEHAMLLKEDSDSKWTYLYLLRLVHRLASALPALQSVTFNWLDYVALHLPYPDGEGGALAVEVFRHAGEVETRQVLLTDEIGGKKACLYGEVWPCRY